MSGPAPKIRVPLLTARLPARDQLIPYLERIDQARWYTNFGPLAHELEARLCDTFRNSGQADPYAITVGSCTAGIELALRALDLPAGAPVLVPVLTFVATATAVLSAGLTPIVSDVDPASWLLTPEIAARAFRSTPFGAVVPVATFGCPQDARGWSEFYATTGTPVVIDAAAGFGNQRDCGPTCSVFSLHATKALAAGEGGFVITRDAKLANNIRQLSNFGINLTNPSAAPIGAVTMVGTNAKLSEYHAAVGLASLDVWTDTASRRRDLYREYITSIRAIPGLMTRWQQAPDDCVRSVCCLLLDSAELRNRAERALDSAGIATRRWYLPLINRHPAFRGIHRRPTPIADDLADHLLGIPFHLDLDRIAQDAVAAALSSLTSR
jgi:dTDP-4-amino-4,6-dideoxygalactose transaminase